MVLSEGMYIGIAAILRYGFRLIMAIAASAFKILGLEDAPVL